MSESRLHTPEVQAKINILLREYEALRSEMQSRLNNRFAMVGYFGAIFTYASLQHEVALEWRIAWGVGAMICLVGVWCRGVYMITRLARRLAQIEDKINSFSDEPLLLWEILQHKQWGTQQPVWSDAGHNSAAKTS